MHRRWVAFCVSAMLGGLFVWLLVSVLPGDGTATDIPARPPQPVVTGELSPSVELLQGMRKYHEIADGALTTPLKVPDSSATVGTARPDATRCEWHANQRRTNADLVELFLYGRIRPSVLARHELLNPADRALCPDEWKELDELLAICNARFEPMASAFQAVVLREMIDCIESGRIQSIAGHIMNEAEIRATARAYAGGDATKEQERMLQLRRSPSAFARGGTNVIIHKGQAYSHADFPDLPQSDRCFSLLRFVAFENLVAVYGWFESRGLAVCNDRVIDTMRRIECVDASQLRRGNRSVGR